MNLKTIESLLKEFRTPIYVFDIGILKERIQYLRENLSKNIKLCYAIKANTFIVKEINDCIDKFEVCSPGEYSICEENQIMPEKIVISGVHKERHVIDYMMETNKLIGRYTVESLEQLKILDELSEKHNLRINVLLRLTSGNQFGINEEDIENIIQNKEKYTNLNFIGIQYFSGTQKRNNKRLQKEIDYIDEFLAELEEKYKFIAEELEFGTGFPVYYFQDDSFNEKDFIKEFSLGINNMKYKGKIIIELGRSIAASCGYYMTKVVDKKTNKDQNYAILDGGIHHIVYYGQTMGMKFPHYEVYPKRNNENEEKWNLMGSLCTINDFIVKQLPVSNLQVGDVFIFKNAGAYCATEGISLFLSRELPGVVLAENGKNILVREAVKTYLLNKANYNL